MFTRSSFLSCLLAAFTLGLSPVPGMTVTDQKGRSIEIELVSLSGDSVTFRRAGNPKEFTMPVHGFDTASQELIRNAVAALPPAKPRLQPDVVIGKRRKDKDGSYYMVRQEVTCTVKLTNLSKNDKVPPVTGKIVFMGQNSKTPDLLTVLSTQTFEMSMGTGETSSWQAEPFVTSYDSDNKGYGNLGGYQYFGYILAVLDKDGNLILDHTTTGSFRKALNENPKLLSGVLDYAKGAAINGKLTPAK